MFSSQEYDLFFSGLKVDIKGFSVLKGVDGHASQGRVLAIMGPSGCGKTTLLNTLYGQYKVKEGEMRLGGRTLNKERLHRISYVTQIDLFFADLTLAETLHFHARLKSDESLTTSDMHHKVESLVELLELKSCLDTQFGDVTQPKLSSGERKRASIACELLGDPRVLILDEPTTGLDATVAFKITDFLHRYAREAGATIVCVIHQPSSKMVHTFDDILLMYMGKTAYQGTLDDAIEQMDAVGLRCDAMENPADFFLDVLSNDTSAGMLVNTKPLLTEAHTMIENTASEDKSETRKWKTVFSQQYRILLERSFKQTWRYILHPFHFAECILIGLMLGCIFFQLPRTEEMLRARGGLLAQLIVLNGFQALATTLELYPQQLEMLSKERFGRLYKLSAYFLATLTTDLLLWGTLPLLQLTIIYWLAGLWADAGTFLAMFGICILLNLATQSVTMLAVICLGTHTGGALADIAVNLFTVTTGFYAVNSRFWLGGIKYISLFYYIYGGMVGLEIGLGPNIACGSNNMSMVPACHNSGVTEFQGIYHVQSLGLISSVLVNIATVMAVFVTCRVAAYVSLQYFRRPQFVQ